MKSFREFTKEEEQEQEQKQEEMLSEALITFQNQVYPLFGNVVILAGGAGSGKGFVKDKLLGIEGWVFDVDELKKLSLKSDKINQVSIEEYGKDLSSLSLKNPGDTEFLHYLLSKHLGIDEKKKQALFASVLVAERKPNLIFDVTLSSFRKLSSLTWFANQLGYAKERVHLVWVLNDVKVALKQNNERERKVPEEILVNTHRGVSQTMNDVLKMGAKLKKYLDGDIWIVPNRVFIDSTTEKSGTGGFWIKEASHFKIKESGQTVSMKKMTKDLLSKIRHYTPRSANWSYRDI